MSLVVEADVTADDGDVEGSCCLAEAFDARELVVFWEGLRKEV